ncbi:hypothetical protein DFH09DRAFT_629317 [Mycena vulgaris]|nr:hypothetical protein DFH09DRAFT_629317 [Mycena vulgaris]
MGATFAIVGLVAAGILFALVTSVMRRRRARRFDREIAEEAKRAPAPVFIDDEDYPGDYHSDPYAGPTAYADHSDAYTGPTAYSGDHPAHTDGGYPASEGLSSGVHSNGVHSNGVHSNPGGGGTPSNYMYPSGYSDLGFSDVSSHGTYSQPPMEGQYNPGTYAAYGGVGAGVGAAGAYEMMGYHNAQQQQQQQHGQEWHPGHQQQEWVAQGYVYPGEEHSAGTTTSYPPTATTTNSSMRTDTCRSTRRACRTAGARMAGSRACMGTSAGWRTRRPMGRAMGGGCSRWRMSRSPNMDTDTDTNEQILRFSGTLHYYFFPCFSSDLCLLVLVRVYGV